MPLDNGGFGRFLNMLNRDNQRDREEESENEIGILKREKSCLTSEIKKLNHIIDKQSKAIIKSKYPLTQFAMSVIISREMIERSESLIFIDDHTLENFRDKIENDFKNTFLDEIKKSLEITDLSKIGNLNNLKLECKMIFNIIEVK